MGKIAIIGHEKAKFTGAGELQAKEAIRNILSVVGANLVSGHCHLGGIDIWAEEIAANMMIGCHIFPPKNLTWEGGYRQRNLQIAECCDEAVSIVVTRLPDAYTGMRFPCCYHCWGAKDHVKSGACWTVRQAMKLGKPGRRILIPNDEFC